MGTGRKSGINNAKSALKNKIDGTVALCKFHNGHSIFIKTKRSVRPITDAEIKRINAEKKTRKIKRRKKVKG
jgi:hypothetical protein